MGIEQVNKTTIRTLDEAYNYNVDKYDVAIMKIHHTYRPSDNYCTVELRVPAISTQIPSEDYEKIHQSTLAPSLHGIRYDKVDNNKFYWMLKRESVDKVRKIKDGLVYTYYFSNTRRLKLFRHDYYMAIAVYLGYPNRPYLRRTPCKMIDPQCINCWDYLAEPVRSYLDESLEEYEASFYKFFFSQIGDIHRVLMGFTVESIKRPGECFTSKEPDYFIVNYDAPYFNGGILNKGEFEATVLQSRRATEERLVHLKAFKLPNVILDEPAYLTDGYNYASYENSGMSGAVYYNIRSGEGPENVISFLSACSFDELWRFDFESFNARNSIHKYQYNHWAILCTRAEDGLWCAWDATETIENGLESSPGSAQDNAEVESQLLQVSTMFGWGPTSDASSSDTVFTFIGEKMEDVNYEDVIEPLPQRESSLF
jgi:hypothetical protein